MGDDYYDDEEFDDEEFDDDEFGDYDEFEDEEELLVGAHYVPAEASINFEMYAIFASFLMLVAAIFIINSNVLEKIYDTSISGGEEWDKLNKENKVTLAQTEVDVLAIGSYDALNKEGAKEFDFAVLNAGSENGLTEGMLYTFDNQGGEKHLCIIVKADPKEAIAEFCEKTTEESKLWDKIHNVEISYGIYQTTKDPSVPLPPFPRKPLPFQYNISREAYDVSDWPEYKSYSVNAFQDEGGSPDFFDFNPSWNMIRRIKWTDKDISTIAPKEGQSFTNELKDDQKKGIIVMFKEYPRAYLLPYDKQSLFKAVDEKLKEVKD